MNPKGRENQGRIAHVIAAILSGGKATRFGGQPKGLLRIRGRRIIDHQLEQLRSVFERVVIITNDPDPWASLGVPLVPDRQPGAGPLAGIEAALLSLTVGEDAAVCLGGDMPFIRTAVLRLLVETAPRASVVAPWVAGRPEPLCARYGRTCLAAIGARLAQGQMKTSAFLEATATQWIDEATFRRADPGLISLQNVNTPADRDRLELGEHPQDEN